MKATICDYCKQPIENETKHYNLVVDEEPKDICFTCFNSPVILSECRRTRTRTVKPKVGRPRGRKTAAPTIDTLVIGDPDLAYKPF